MAETESYIKQHKLPSQITSNQTDPGKYYTNFLYKAVIVSVFLVILPLLPSQAPEFITQTRSSWELLQLLFVGVLVTYGLFSRKNEETEDPHGSKFDNAHTFLSRFLQISPVFDDESDSPSGSDENRVQTWSNQYYREEPVLVVAQNSSVLEEQRDAYSVFSEKPLLLPVRSLKSRVTEYGFAEGINESIGKGLSLTRSNSYSNSGSKRFSSNSRNGVLGNLNSVDSNENPNSSKGSAVLRSPIPWRSRSGRTEMREETEIPRLSLSHEAEEPKFPTLESPSFRPQFSLSSRPTSDLFSTSKLSPPPTYPSESQPRNQEDDVPRKKIYYAPKTPPPAPPPPPPHHHRKPPPVKSNSIPAKEWTGVEIDPLRAEKGKSEGILGLGGNDEAEGEGFEGGLDRGGEEREERVSNGAGDLGPDVNKKAEEFIAKFREQIRLQRMESFRRSPGNIARNPSR